MDKLHIFIGWDSREDIAYQVCAHSLFRHSKSNLSIIPLKQHELRQNNIYTRPTDNLSSTEFTFTRFLVPYLMNYEGWALFIDCDFLFTTDVKELFDLAHNDYAVMVAKHDYKPTELVKMDGKSQSLYPRKNWSSCILWNCSHPDNRIITPDLINNASGAFLHRFRWLEDETIGEFDYSWNFLEGWYTPTKDKSPNAIHYTRGNVYFKEYQNVDYADLWKEEYMLYSGKKWTDSNIIN